SGIGLVHELKQALDAAIFTTAPVQQYECTIEARIDDRSQAVGRIQMETVDTGIEQSGLNRLPSLEADGPFGRSSAIEQQHPTEIRSLDVERFQDRAHARLPAVVSASSAWAPKRDASSEASVPTSPAPCVMTRS